MNSFTRPILEEIQRRKQNMIIVFNGNDSLDLEERLQQFSSRDMTATLNFMLRNFKIPSREELERLMKQTEEMNNGEM